jgi:hypothetical protein
MRNTGRRSTNKSGFKGVHWCKRDKKWIAAIHLDGRQQTLGYFVTPEAAYEVYCTAANDHHGDFARLA